MSKLRVSIKDVKNSFTKVFRCGYCDLQYIMYSNPYFYNSGVYGWNCDIYVSYGHDIAITTGYRNMAGYRIPSELIEKYNKIASAIDWKDTEYREKRLQIENDFFNELAKLDTKSL